MFMYKFPSKFAGNKATRDLCLVTTIIIIIIIISNGNRTEWNTIQGVIGRVIWNYEHDYPWIVWHEVLLPVNCVDNKMRETF